MAGSQVQVSVISVSLWHLRLKCEAQVLGPALPLRLQDLGEARAGSQVVQGSSLGIGGLVPTGLYRAWSPATMAADTS